MGVEWTWAEQNIIARNVIVIQNLVGYMTCKELDVCLASSNTSFDYVEDDCWGVVI